MANKDIPDEVKNFIYEYIDSLEQLEILLFLYNHSLSYYNAEMIASELRLNPESVATRLTSLLSYRFLLSENDQQISFQYNQGNKSNDSISLLNRYYIDYKYSLINLIFSKPIENVSSYLEIYKVSNLSLVKAEKFQKQILDIKNNF